ncbi:hypothetical protein JOM56_010274 [Amanita muscaria]
MEAQTSSFPDEDPISLSYLKPDLRLKVIEIIHNPTSHRPSKSGNITNSQTPCFAIALCRVLQSPCSTSTTSNIGLSFHTSYHTLVKVIFSNAFSVSPRSIVRNAVLFKDEVEVLVWRPWHEVKVSSPHDGMEEKAALTIDETDNDQRMPASFPMSLTTSFSSSKEDSSGFRIAETALMCSRFVLVCGHVWVYHLFFVLNLSFGHTRWQQLTLIVKEQSSIIPSSLPLPIQKCMGRLLKPGQAFLTSEAECVQKRKRKGQIQQGVNMEESVGNTDNFADSGCARRVLKGKLQANDAVTSVPSLRTNFQSLRLVIWRSHSSLNAIWIYNPRRAPVNDTGERLSGGHDITIVLASNMPKTIAQRPMRSGSVSIQNKSPKLKGTKSAIYKLPSDLPKLRRQPEKGTPTVPSHLALNSEERGQLQSHLDLVGVDKHRFEYTQQDQDLNLHLGINDIPRDARSKMSIVYSDSGKVGPTKKYTRWTHLYQCLCGTNHEEGRYPSKKRFRPWKNVKCNMYARVISTHGSSEILAINEVSGILEHSDACQDIIQMDRKPAIPLHPELREYALSLLRDRVPIGQVRLLCREWSIKRWGNLAGDVNYRYVLMEYCTISVNFFKILFILAKVTYQFDETKISSGWSQVTRGDELTEIVQYESTSLYRTLRQEDDDRNIGIPVATIIFTPKKDAKAGHASYDGPLLSRVLQHWKDGMGTNSVGEHFEIKIANTDNDPRERHGLQAVWKDIFLVLCMFHTWQSWRNGMTRYLACIPKGDARKHARSRLGKFLMWQLKDVTDYSDAIVAYNAELEYFRSLSKDGCTALDKAKSTGGLAFLAYFKSYLALQGFWKSWSRAGIIEAARILQTAVDKVPRTTNHLESFNGHIKLKYFAAYQHSGRLPRLDMWVLLIGTRVTADFFAEYDERRRTEEYYQMMRFAPPSLASPAETPSSSLHGKEANSESIIPSPATRERQIVTSLTDDVENSMLQELRDDDCESEVEETSEDDPYLDKHHVLEGMGCHLIIDSDGQGSSISTIESQSDNTTEDFDIALDASDILDHLPSSSGDSFPFPLAQPTGSRDTSIPDDAIHNVDDLGQETGSDILADLDINLVGIDSLSWKPQASDDILPSNSEVIAYQQVLAAEDHLLECIRTLLTVSNSSDIQTVVKPHLSPRIRSQLPSSLLSKEASEESRPSNDNGSQKGQEENCRQHVPLLQQRKERRKQSYSIR